MESIIILIKLLCAHLCSDFIFQTDSINNGKRKPGIKGIGYLLFHSAIHAGVAYLLVADWSCWLVPLVIFASHFIIDLIKCKCYQDSLSTFLADQFLHIIIIGVLWFVLYGDGTVLSYIENHCSANVWLTVVARTTEYVLIGTFSSFTIAILTGIAIRSLF